MRSVSSLGTHGFGTIPGPVSLTVTVATAMNGTDALELLLSRDFDILLFAHRAEAIGEIVRYETARELATALESAAKAAERERVKLHVASIAGESIRTRRRAINAARRDAGPFQVAGEISTEYEIESADFLSSTQEGDREDAKLEIIEVGDEERERPSLMTRLFLERSKLSIACGLGFLAVVLAATVALVGMGVTSDQVTTGSDGEQIP